MADRTSTLTLTLALLAATGCPDDPGQAPEAEGSSTAMSAAESTTGAAESTTSDPTTGVDTTAGGVEDTTGAPPLPPLPCPDDWSCQQDQDGDGWPLVCDNDPDHANPDQGDMDYDSVGDTFDLCPTLQTLGITGDSDDDGVGNDCDLCRARPAQYLGEIVLPARYTIRNIPAQSDADRDGIGDACDNCPTVPNCLSYGEGPGLTPYALGMPLDLADEACQADADADGVGDACEGEMGPGAAGAVGFAMTDDFDQDGLTNAIDYCPRLPTTLGTCAGPGDCPLDSPCNDGVCNHLDPDGDGVGTECDTCPFAANPLQVVDGMQAGDDDDDDFVGDICETHPSCESRTDPRPIRFYDVSVGGYCCTTLYQGQELFDPDGNPLDIADLPTEEPGVLTLPPGCEAALAEAGVSEATALGPLDVGGVDELWPYMCFVPQWDQDFDGLGDQCDLCEFAFDPDNTPFVDSSGMEWPNDGAFCNGEYNCSAQED